MTEAAAALILIALIGALVLAAILWPTIWRLYILREDNDELQRQHDRLARENHERARRILKRWTPPEGPS